MIELLVTCWIASAAIFAVPEDWAVREVRAAGDPCAWTRGPTWSLSVMCFPPPPGDRLLTQARVVLTKRLKAGEPATVPPGCTVELVEGGRP